jgi:chemotaxis signal transduction protein
MSDAGAQLSGRAAELRQAFDRSFAEARALETAETTDLLAVALSGVPHALRLNEVGGLFADKRVRAFPSRIPELRGIAAFKRAMLPLFDLGALLGYPPSNSARWIVVSAQCPLAFTIAEFQGHLRLPASAIIPAEGAGRRDDQGETAIDGGILRPLVNLHSIANAVHARASAGAVHKEH